VLGSTLFPSAERERRWRIEPIADWSGPSNVAPFGSYSITRSLDHWITFLITRSLRRQAAIYNSGWRSNRFAGIIIDIFRKTQRRQGAARARWTNRIGGIAGSLSRKQI